MDSQRSTSVHAEFLPGISRSEASDSSYPALQNFLGPENEGNVNDIKFETLLELVNSSKTHQALNLPFSSENKAIRHMGENEDTCKTSFESLLKLAQNRNTHRARNSPFGSHNSDESLNLKFPPMGDAADSSSNDNSSFQFAPIQNKRTDDILNLSLGINEIQMPRDIEETVKESKLQEEKLTVQSKEEVSALADNHKAGKEEGLGTTSVESLKRDQMPAATAVNDSTKPLKMRGRRPKRNQRPAATSTTTDKFSHVKDHEKVVNDSTGTLKMRGRRPKRNQRPAATHAGEVLTIIGLEKVSTGPDTILEVGRCCKRNQGLAAEDSSNATDLKEMPPSSNGTPQVNRNYSQIDQFCKSQNHYIEKGSGESEIISSDATHDRDKNLTEPKRDEIGPQCVTGSSQNSSSNFFINELSREKATVRESKTCSTQAGLHSTTGYGNSYKDRLPLNVYLEMCFPLIHKKKKKKISEIVYIPATSCSEKLTTTEANYRMTGACQFGDNDDSLPSKNNAAGGRSVPRPSSH